MIAPVAHLGAVLGRNDKAAYAWQSASKWRDAGDMPSRVNRDVLRYARRNGIPLTADHLIWGADEAEIAALIDPANRNNAPQAAE